MQGESNSADLGAPNNGTLRGKAAQTGISTIIAALLATGVGAWSRPADPAYQTAEQVEAAIEKNNKLIDVRLEAILAVSTNTNTAVAQLTAAMADLRVQNGRIDEQVKALKESEQAKE